MKLFHNWSTEDFKITWDGKPFTIKAGEVVRETIKDANGQILILEPSILETWAVHLADREMDKDGIDPRRRMREDELYEGYISRALTDKQQQKVETEVIEVDIEEKKEDTFDCGECGKETKSKAGLAAHKRSHKKPEDII